MARRTKRKWNPGGAATALLSIGAAAVGGVGGFVLASYGCRKMLDGAMETGQCQRGRWVDGQFVPDT